MYEKEGSFHNVNPAGSDNKSSLYETAKRTTKTCFFFCATHFSRDLFSGPQITKQKHQNDNLIGTCSTIS
jgi:hypothetical protein